MKSPDTALRAKHSLVSFTLNTFWTIDWHQPEDTREVVMQGNISGMLVLVLSCAPASTACLKWPGKVYGYGLTSGNRFLCSCQWKWQWFRSPSCRCPPSPFSKHHLGNNPEGLPTIMARSSLGFRISVLHIPWGGHHLQQLIQPSTIAPCRKYSGSLSTTVLNKARFGFMILVSFPRSCTIIFCSLVCFFYIILSLVVLVVVCESTHKQ